MKALIKGLDGQSPGDIVGAVAGDHRQLPPTVKNQKAAEELEHTLFEKLTSKSF